MSSLSFENVAKELPENKHLPPDPTSSPQPGDLTPVDTLMISPERHRTTNSSTYPDPLIVLPTLSHQETFIILHGRGSNAQTFGLPLLSTQLPNRTTLQTSFPHAKFIFPTATKRRAKAYKRSIIHQWYDSWSLSDPTEKEELMLDGLRETTVYIHGLLVDAIEEVGAKNVVLGGLSQGCAATLIALLAWEGDALATAFGLCGWLPLQQHIMQIVRPPTLSDDDGEDIFARDNDADQELGKPAQAVAWLREELGLPEPTKLSLPKAPTTDLPTAPLSPPVRLPFQGTPVFLAHGVEDEKVPMKLGREAAICMESLEVDVEWKEYVGLGHWYSGTMLGDLVTFLKQNTRWEEEGHVEDVVLSDGLLGGIKVDECLGHDDGCAVPSQ